MSLARPNPDQRPQTDLFGRYYRWRNNLVANPTFQRWASRFYLTRSLVRRDGERLFDLVAGFVHSQVLQAVVELDLLAELKERPRTAAELAFKADVPVDRMTVLCNAATAVDLMTRGRDGTYGLARLGAATLGVPGLADMIRHHSILYRDLGDPTAFLRGEKATELARFWPYVFGESDPETSATYSRLMAETQAMVAEETLDAVSLGSASHLMDVGGGTGAFLKAVRERHPNVSLTLFDLPDVVAGAHFADPSIRLVSGHFTDDALPCDVDAISLVRVLYDHADETVMSLFDNVLRTLPPGGRLIVSEPMAGDRRPERATDAYFAFYTMAMQTGRVRSPSEISAMLTRCGFVDIRKVPTRRPFITGVITARCPEHA